MKFIFLVLFSFALQLQIAAKENNGVVSGKVLEESTKLPLQPPCESS